MAQLRAWALEAIGQGLESVAARWAKITVDRMPLPGQTLDTLQHEYQELWESLPDCAAQDIERLLRRYTGGMRVDDQHLSASQSRFLEARLRLIRRGGISPRKIRIKAPDDTWEWIQPIFRHPGSLVRTMTVPSALYIVSQRSLGAHYSTFPEAFRDELCKLDVQQVLVGSRGEVRLVPLIEAQSRWLAQTRVQTIAEPADVSLPYDLGEDEHKE